MKTRIWIMTILGTLLMVSCANITNTQQVKEVSNATNLMDEGIASIRKGELDKGYQMLQQYLKENPAEKKWLNIWLGFYHYSKGNYEQAEKYYNQATWFEHSEIDGLKVLEYIIPYTHVLPREQIKTLILGYWHRIRIIYPSSYLACKHYYWRDRLDKPILEIDVPPLATGNNMRFAFQRQYSREASSPNLVIHGDWDQIYAITPKDEAKGCLLFEDLFNEVYKYKEAKDTFSLAEMYKWIAYEYQFREPAYMYAVGPGGRVEGPGTDFERRLMRMRIGVERLQMKMEPMFVRLADCLTELGDGSIRHFAEDPEGAKKNLDYCIGNYKTAIYYLHRSYYSFNDPSMCEFLTMPLNDGDTAWLNDIQSQIAALRQKIKAVEVQLKSIKESKPAEPPQPPSPK